MKLLFGLLVCTSLNSFAQDCTLKINSHTGMANFWDGKYDSEVAEVMTEKGYTVLNDGPSSYTLRFGGGTGFVCGTGLTSFDYHFNLDGSYTIELSGPGIEISKEKGFNGIALGMNERVKRRAFRQLRALPDCQSTNLMKGK